MKIGTYEIICAQLCGLGHYSMRATVVVDSDADYKSWLDDMEKLNAPAPAAPSVPSLPSPPAAGGQK